MDLNEQYIISWFGNLSSLKPSYLVIMAGKVMGPTLLKPPPKKSQSPQSTVQQPTGFLSDPSLVLNFEYVLMNSGRRYRVLLCKHIHINWSHCQLNLLTVRSWRANRLRSKTSERSTFKQDVFSVSLRSESSFIYVQRCACSGQSDFVIDSLCVFFFYLQAIFFYTCALMCFCFWL